jgi:hypothetical protein
VDCDTFWSSVHITRDQDIQPPTGSIYGRSGNNQRYSKSGVIRTSRLPDMFRFHILARLGIDRGQSIVDSYLHPVAAVRAFG